MHRDWWGPSRDTRVSFLSLFLFLARSFSPIGPIVSSLSLSDRVPCTFFSLFSPVFNSSCLFFSFFFSPSHFTFFVNRTVRVSSGEKVDALLPSKLSRFRLSSPFELKKKITYDRLTFKIHPFPSRRVTGILSKKILSLSLSRSLLFPPPCCHTRDHIWLGARVDDPQRSSTTWSSSSSLSRRSANRRICAIERGEGQGITHGTRPPPPPTPPPPRPPRPVASNKLSRSPLCPHDTVCLPIFLSSVLPSTAVSSSFSYRFSSTSSSTSSSSGCLAPTLSPSLSFLSYLLLLASCPVRLSLLAYALTCGTRSYVLDGGASAQSTTTLFQDRAPSFIRNP